MNAPLHVPLDDNVIELFDLVGRPRSPRPSTQPPEPEPSERRPPLTPAQLLRVATMGGLACALVVALVIPAVLLASGQPLTTQQGWMIATYALLAFSFGITAGSVGAVARERVLARSNG